MNRATTNAIARFFTSFRMTAKTMPHDPLNEGEITTGLATKRLGRKVYALVEVDSTNTYAMKLAAAGEPEGSLVVSEFQTGGRGRLGRKWVSPPGANITMSLILRPDMPPADAPLITLAASVALVKSVKGMYGLHSGIKWPNDLMVKDRKMAGVLTEMSAGTDRIRHVILGVGIDVNMKEGDFPDEIRGLSTSVMLETGGPVERASLLRRFIEEFEPLYEVLLAGEKGRIIAEWRENSCTLGRRVTVHTPRGEVSGIARDIDESGALILDTDEGETETVTAGDVGFI